MRFDEQEDDDGEGHAEDGDGEANVGDGLQLMSMNPILSYKLRMNIENQSKIGQVVTGTLGMGIIVTQSDTSIP